MRIVNVVMCGALLALPGLASAGDQEGNNVIPKEHKVQIKNPKKADASKSSLTVPERKFVEKAASDNIAEIELGRLALDKTRNAEVRNYAQRIVDDHQKSLDQLKSIANDQSFPLPTSATTLTQKDYQRLAKLDGDQFDREYMKLMEKRHAEAVSTFQKASDQIQNQDLKNYADKTLPTLKEHEKAATQEMKSTQENQ